MNSTVVSLCGKRVNDFCSVHAFKRVSLRIDCSQQRKYHAYWMTENRDRDDSEITYLKRKRCRTDILDD